MNTFYVTTRYYGPTNHRGSRIRVAGPLGRKMVAYPYATSEDAHIAAVREIYPFAVIEYCTNSESERGNVYRVTVGE